MYRSFTALSLALIFALTACGRDLNSTTYSDSATTGKVLKGTVISTRIVKVKAHEKLEDNKLGGLAGGAAGAVGGSEIGSGNGSLAAAIGGAVVGAVAGAYLQDALSQDEAMEYIVQIDRANARSSKSGVKRYKAVKESTKGTVKEDVATSIDTDMETDIVSVVQKADPAIAEGARVFIIYSDDRPRLAPMTLAK